MQYLYNINNYVASEILGNRLPFESFWGETPDMSMIRSKFWEPVYYRTWMDKTCKVIMHPGRFMRFAWNIGDYITFKVPYCNKNLHKRNVFFHKSVVVPRYQTATGYSSALAPKSDAYFPVVQVEGGLIGIQWDNKRCKIRWVILTNLTYAR